MLSRYINSKEERKKILSSCHVDKNSRTKSKNKNNKQDQRAFYVERDGKGWTAYSLSSTGKHSTIIDTYLFESVTYTLFSLYTVQWSR